MLTAKLAQVQAFRRKELNSRPINSGHIDGRWSAINYLRNFSHHAFPRIGNTLLGSLPSTSAMTCAPQASSAARFSGA